MVMSKSVLLVWAKTVLQGLTVAVLMYVSGVINKCDMSVVYAAA